MGTINQLVKYRYYRAGKGKDCNTVSIGSFKQTDWRTVPLGTFKHIFKHLPANVFSIEARVHQLVKGTFIFDSEYKLVDAWDWFRMGRHPRVDEQMKYWAKEKPEKYKLTSSGVWIHRDDLLERLS